MGEANGYTMLPCGTGRQDLLTQLLPNLPYKGDGSLPQCIVEGDPIAPPFGMRVDGPLRHVSPEHFLEAQRLRAECRSACGGRLRPTLYSTGKGGSVRFQTTGPLVAWR